MLNFFSPLLKELRIRQLEWRIKHAYPTCPELPEWVIERQQLVLPVKGERM